MMLLLHVYIFCHYLWLISDPNHPILKEHSVERIYLRQQCFDASKPRVAAATGAQYHARGIFPT